MTDTVLYQNWKGHLGRRLTTTELAAAYNYIFVANDGSYGVHNFKYAEKLLSSSIEQLQLAAGAGTVTQVTDIPSDNGKQVQVVWSQFPAEIQGTARVTSYSVWRQDPLLPGSTVSYKAVNSFTELIKSGKAGVQVTMGGSVWTFVSTVPATNQATYAVIAPTLFDSTKTSGMYYTKFFVSGLATDGTVYKTLADSGYSLNNLVPFAPAGLVVTVGNGSATLTWNPPTPRDNDIDHYVVFRGTTAAFDPTGTTPLAKVTSFQYVDNNVPTGSVYYYKIAAVDNGGNVSPYAVGGTTGVEATGSNAPKEFALAQNYPNPFNPTTQIQFALPKESHVKIVVYNVAGSEIATLVNSTMGTGSYTLTWNGTNDAGEHVSSGVYLYRIQAGEYTSVRKMVMLK